MIDEPKANTPQPHLWHWQHWIAICGVVAGLLIAATTIYFSRSTRRVDVRFLSETRLLTDAATSGFPNLKISHAGSQVSNATIVALRISNTGSEDLFFESGQEDIQQPRIMVRMPGEASLLGISCDVPDGGVTTDVTGDFTVLELHLLNVGTERQFDLLVTNYPGGEFPIITWKGRGLGGRLFLAREDGDRLMWLGIYFVAMGIFMLIFLSVAVRKSRLLEYAHFRMEIAVSAGFVILGAGGFFVGFSR